MLANLLVLALTSQTPVFGDCLPVSYQGTALDVGTCAAPLFHDWDQDGLYDLIVGCRFPYDPFSGPCGCAFFFPNEGIPASPLFEIWEPVMADGDTITTQT